MTSGRRWFSVPVRRHASSCPSGARLLTGAFVAATMSAAAATAVIGTVMHGWMLVLAVIVDVVLIAVVVAGILRLRSRVGGRRRGNHAATGPGRG